MAKSKQNGLKRRAAHNGRLSVQERAFAAAWVADPERNGAAAARKAKYADAKGAACRLLKRPHVRAFLRELEAEARKHVKVKRGKVVDVEVLPPAYPLPTRSLPPAHIEKAENAAIASRSEVLAMATNVIRTHESRKLGDLFSLTEGRSPTLVSNAKAISELPLSAVKGLKHDAAGDLELKLADPLAAGRLLLDDHSRAAGAKGAADLASALLEVLRGAIEGRAQGELAE